MAESAVSIKTLLKSSVERVFEKVKSVTRVNDKLIVGTTEGEQLNFSRLQIKSELMADGMSGQAAENVLKCLENGCFSGDTLVGTKDGLKRIDTIREGEYVLAKDVNTGIIDYKQVKTVYIKSTYEFVHLKLDDEEIRTTASHLFFTDSGWWKAAGDLKPGDRILTAKGELKEVTATTVETLQQPERIYNLNVEDYHTYFVGSQGLLVHNNCTADMMAAGREAVANARARGIADSKILSEVGSKAADAVGDARAIGITDATQIQKISDNAAEAVINGRKFTEPTLPAGGKPQGKYEAEIGDDATIRSIKRQNEAANTFADKGYDMEMLPYKKDGNGYGLTDGSNPDYLINGEVFDCYAPDTPTVRNIWRNVQLKTETQAKRIVLNLDDYPGSMDELAKQFNEWPIDTLDELLVLKNGNISRLIIK